MFLEKVIPLPKERECITILGEDNEVAGYINKPKHNKLGRDYFVGFRSGFEGLASMDLTGEQYKVLMYLFSRLDFDNFLKVSQKDISEKLKLHKSNVSKAIKRLVELDIIAIGPMAGHSKTYRLNPRIAHRGSKNYQETIIQYDDLKNKKEEITARRSQL